jgi:ADP-ribose pyrophosphatase YjhB (NUDIX family)
VILFYGSPKEDLEAIQPEPCSAGRLVFASPDLRVAVAFSRPWTDDDMEIRLENGRVELHERRRGTLSLLKGPGYVYAIPDSTPFRKFVKKGEEVDFEYVTEQTVAGLRILEVPNVLHACQLLRFSLHPYGVDPKRASHVRVFVTRNGYQGILLHHFLKARKWGPPAGRVERGENVFFAGARELLERTGWKGSPADFRMLGCYADKDGHAWHCLQVDFDDLQWSTIPQTEIRWSDGSQIATTTGDTLEISALKGVGARRD